MSEASWTFVLGAGALFALASALHCAGMCGAFALAVAGAPAGRGARLLLYLLGKTFTYVFLGALAGAAGAGVAQVFGPARLLLGVLVGAALLLAGWRFLVGGAPARAPGVLSSALARALAGPLAALRQRGGAGAAFSLGALTGLLPCGVAWLAALQAAALGGPARGAVFLAAFGAGTAPALLAVGLLGGGLFSRAGARRARLAGGGLLVAAGLLALLRVGLSAGTGDGGSCPACPP